MKIEEYKNIKSLNTFGIDVTSRRYLEIDKAEELIQFFKSFSGKWMVLGGGSNILFTENYDGTLLHPVNQDIELLERGDDFVLIRAGAGVQWDSFVSYTLERGFYGLENLSYIPGTVGASPVQNIGAYGVEAKDTIFEVEYFDVDTLSVNTIRGEQCEFGYRHSIFKSTLKERVVVLSVVYKLSLKFTPLLSYGGLLECFECLDNLSATELRDVIIKIRKEKLPDPTEIGNGGSFFKNPVILHSKFENLKREYPNVPSYPAGDGVKIPAAWLIDSCGWKGRRVGDAGVHKNQALVLVNYGTAKGSEVVELSKNIQHDVFEKFGVEIFPEINIL